MIASRLATLATLPAQGGGVWLPEQASTVAPEVDSTFWLIMWISVAFFAVIVVPMAWFMWVYRRRPGTEAVRTATHNYTLELSWSIIPTLIIVVIFAKGFFGFLDLRTPPAETYDIRVVAKKWAWTFLYPTGFVSDELHAPANRPVKLIMASDDVIHSLFLRDFRVKQDVVPGRYSYLWFNATKTGTFPLMCTEYCGRNHSDMITNAVIHAEDEFETWLAEKFKEEEAQAPLQYGELLYTRRGCSTCHSLDGSKRVGPSFNQTYQSTHEFTDGSKSVGDENYIQESIINPQAKVRAGYQGVMPTYKGQLSDRALRALVLYVAAQNPAQKAKIEEESKRLEAEYAAEREAKEGEQGQNGGAGQGGGDQGGAPAGDAGGDAAGGR